MNGIAGVIGDGGRRDLFYLDRGLQLKQRTFDGTDWVINWIELGGIFTSVPAVVARMDTHRPLVGPDLGDVVVTTDLTPVAGGGASPVLPTPSATTLSFESLAPAATVPATAWGGPFGPEVTEQRIDVFGLGLDYALYYKTLWGPAVDRIGPWRNLGGVFTSAPAAIWVDDQLHVFGLGIDLAMYWRSWTRAGWSDGWARVGGYFTSPPVVVSWGSGRLDVFARGADFTLRHRLFRNGVWAGDWQNLGGTLASAPAAVSWGPERIDVFAVGNRDGTTPDGGLVHRWWDGDLWNDWEQIAGRATGDEVAFESAPAVATTGPGRLDVLAVDSTGTLRHTRFADSAWGNPDPISRPETMRSTPLVLATGTDQVEVIAQGRDHNMWRKTLTGGSWDSPLDFWILGDHAHLPCQYRISVDFVEVKTARSFNNDTVTGQCTLKVGSWPTSVGRGDWPLRTRTQRIGAMGLTGPDDAHTNLLNLDPVTIDLHETAAFAYTFVNSDEPNDVVTAALMAQADTLADKTTKAAVDAAASGVGITAVQVDDLAAPLTGSVLALLASWLGDQLSALIADKCDGAVAAENFVRRGDDLHRMTAGGKPVVFRVTHHGADSPFLCGARSEYLVTWSITRLSS